MAKAKKNEVVTATETTEAAEVETVQTEAAEVETAETEQVDLIDLFMTEILPPIVEKHGANEYDIMKATEAASRDFAGDANKEKRVQFFAQALDADPETINANKASTTALGALFFRLYKGETDFSELAATVTKKVTDTVPTESETALVTTFANIEQASNELRSLSLDDVNKVQSAVMAGFQVALKLLGTEKVKFPRQCSDFLSILIAASNGSTDWFKCSDTFIAETSGISAKTVARGREKLIEFMNETGKGIVSIKAETAQPTFYKVNLLETVSLLVHKRINSEYGTEAMLTVAAVSGRLLTESTDKIRTEVSDADLQAAKSLNSSLRDAIDTLPEPSIVAADNVAATKQAATKKRFGTIREELGTALEQAYTAGLDETVKAIETLSSDAQSIGDKFDKDGIEPDLSKLEAGLAKAKDEISKAGKGKVEEAKAKAEAEKAESGEVSQETRRTIAQASVEATADVAAEVDNSFENFSNAAYLLATANAEPEAKQAAYLKCLDILNMAFQMQQYKAEA